jgi:hypothetical protein
MLEKNTHQQFGSEVPPLQFAPADGPAFFARCGWNPIEVHSMLKTAAGLKRLTFAMRDDDPRRNGALTAYVYLDLNTTNYGGFVDKAEFYTTASACLRVTRTAGQGNTNLNNGQRRGSRSFSLSCSLSSLFCSTWSSGQ